MSLWHAGGLFTFVKIMKDTCKANMIRFQDKSGATVMDCISLNHRQMEQSLYIVIMTNDRV